MRKSICVSSVSVFAESHLVGRTEDTIDWRGSASVPRGSQYRR
jgi:hypothetical protein